MLTQVSAIAANKRWTALAKQNQHLNRWFNLMSSLPEFRGATQLLQQKEEARKVTRV